MKVLRYNNVTTTKSNHQILVKIKPENGEKWQKVFLNEMNSVRDSENTVFIP